MSIGLLHLTDFHQGMHGQKISWPQVKESFFDDLSRLHDVAGPWDLVLFTGDLTQRGSAEEFAAFDDVYETINLHVRSLGSSPILLAVPGNHDLVRPPTSATVVNVAKSWFEGIWDIEADTTSKRFFDDEHHPLRAVVAEAFSNYDVWWRKRIGLARGTIRPGVLPGDFSASFEIGGRKLAVVGLNSSFLHLHDDVRAMDLDVNVRQFTALDDDMPAWLRRHDAALLMTHHPVDWLHPHAQRLFAAYVNPPSRFAAHLFGHMHEGEVTEQASGGTNLRRSIQGLSLFGLEKLPTGTERRHGYCAMILSIDGETGRLALWPRSLELNKTSFHYRMVPDFARYELDDSNSVEMLFPTLRTSPLASRSGSAGSPLAVVLQMANSGKNSATAHLESKALQTAAEAIRGIVDSAEKLYWIMREGNQAADIHEHMWKIRSCCGTLDALFDDSRIEGAAKDVLGKWKETILMRPVIVMHLEKFFDEWGNARTSENVKSYNEGEAANFAETVREIRAQSLELIRIAGALETYAKIATGFE